MNQKIYTVDARDNMLLEVIRDRNQLNTVQVHKIISNTFTEMLSILDSKKIKYTELKNALIPNLDKNEIALVFDTAKITSDWYGAEVFKKIIPLFNRKSSHSILCGDYIGHNDSRFYLYDAFMANIITEKEIDYHHHSQFYFVYINNLSNKMVADFHHILNSYNGYVGHFDLNYSSLMKTFLSTILCKAFVKHKNYIITGHEDDLENEVDCNMLGYEFEENNYICRSLQSTYTDLFLSYKIERPTFSDDQDTFLSINSVTEDATSIVDFNLIVEESKLQYLLQSKTGIMKKAGLLTVTKENLAGLIKEKMESNYIYNLSYNDEYNVIKFNIIIEIPVSENGEIVKLLIALEYVNSDKSLRLLTLY